MKISSVGIVGAGTMGSGIAINVAQSGLPVYLNDLSEAPLEKAVAAVSQTSLAGIICDAVFFR